MTKPEDFKWKLKKYKQEFFSIYILIIILNYKKVILIGLLCVFVFSLSDYDFWDGFKDGVSFKTEKVENEEK